MTARKETGITNIRGKEYQTVALRVTKFRADKEEWSLTTEIVSRDADCVVMKAIITNEQGRILATGHAEEYRSSSQVNKTSALENAETSAIGRALAAAGYGGTEFASANEVQNAIHQQENPQEGGMPDAEYNRLTGMMRSAGVPEGKLLNEYSVSSLRALNQDQYGEIIGRLTKVIEAKAKATTNEKAGGFEGVEDVELAA